MGRWVKSSFPEGNSLENLYDLNSTYNGIIISPKLADNLELQIGDRLPITDLPGGIYYRQFVIVGFLESAPGLGLMEGANIELFQENQGIILMNNKYMANELKVVNSPLFLASMKKEGNKQVITNEIKELLPEATVNPTQINEDFVGTFIETYVPKAQIFFWISLGTTLLLGAILLIMITDFVLYQRLQEYAIKRVLGLSKKRIIRLILIEILVISLSVSVIGVALGLSFTYSTFNIIIPIITAHNIIPIEISIPLWQVFLFPIIIIFFAVIDVFPLIFKHSNKKIISSLYQ
ncbi:MAG: FtsX-like permease family protein [Asgard group archaeon]|nr:FtsX-like permease family protein [Asgard group archaeon]